MRGRLPGERTPAARHGTTISDIPGIEAQNVFADPSRYPRPLRLALVGLGAQGREHLSVLTGCPAGGENWKLAALCDPLLASSDFRGRLPERAKNLRMFESAEALLKSQSELNLDAAVVAVPPYLYKKLLPALLRQGLDLLVEKPLGMNLEEAARLVGLARRKNRVLMPAVQRRFHPSYQQILKEAAAFPRVEEVLLRLHITAVPSGWRARKKVGALLDLGFHAIDFLREFFGDLRLISALLTDDQGRRSVRRWDSSAHVLFLSESGSFIRVDIARCAKRKEEFLLASAAGAELFASRSEWFIRDGRGGLRNGKAAADWNHAMRLQLNAFVAACQRPENKSLPRIAQMGLATMELIEEIYNYAATH